MDHERLTQSVYKLDQRAKELDEATKRQSKESARIEERFAPFKELQARNKAIFDRASKLTQATPTIYPEGHNTRVIIGSVVPTAPNHIIIAQVTTTNGQSPDGDYRKAHFEFFSAESSYASEVGNNPDNYLLRKDIAVHSQKLEGTNESTYATGIYDEIAERANRCISGRAFSPLMATDRSKLRESIDSRLGNLELSMDMIDQAARNPELNPVLAHALVQGEESQTAFSQK